MLINASFASRTVKEFNCYRCTTN